MSLLPVGTKVSSLKSPGILVSVLDETQDKITSEVIISEDLNFPSSCKLKHAKINKFCLLVSDEGRYEISSSYSVPKLIYIPTTLNIKVIRWMFDIRISNIHLGRQMDV